MSEIEYNHFTVFADDRQVSTGPLCDVILDYKRLLEPGTLVRVLMFDDATGRSVDFDIRGTNEEVVSRVEATTDPQISAGDDEPVPEGESRRRGRPKLGVVAREVTLLPRHWEWLSAQPGGASIALRKLVEEARRTNRDKDKIRWMHERAYHFMSAMAGDLPGFEEATRALFANDKKRFCDIIQSWPEDVRNHATHLGFRETSPN